MRRAVITGVGIVCSLGNNAQEVLQSLKQGKSGIVFKQDYVDHGLRSHVAGEIALDVQALIDRKLIRFMGNGHAYAWLALQEAIKDAALEDHLVSNPRTGLIVGAGGPSTQSLLEATDTLKEKGIRRVGPYVVTKGMCSGVSACLTTYAQIKGINYGISSACSTSAHCIGAALEQIQLGKQDIVFAGGAEEEHWSLSMLFDAMGALSCKYNDQPAKASRTYDADRDGFVISGGGGIVVVEEYEHAKARGAKIYAEITGYGATSDGFDMVAPSGEGAQRCMQQALLGTNGQTIGKIDYINSHGTSTAVGDVKELQAIKATFDARKAAYADENPIITSTKSLSGHSLGAAGVHETIYTLLMMQHGFIAASANIDNLDEAAKGFNIARTTIEKTTITNALTNSFGFGGTNATLVLTKI